MNIHISGEMLFIGWLIILITLIWIGNNISKLPSRYENSYVQNISDKVNDIEACLCHLFGVENATEISFLELNAE
jgi:hypothetical protein